MRKQGFVQGAMILAAAGLVSRLFGAVYRIVLTRLIETEAMGLFSMAYSIYTVILGLSAYGIPVAVSKLVAEREAWDDHLGAKRVFRLALILLASLGLLFSVLLFLLAEPLAHHVYQDPRAFLSLRAVAPAILFVSVMAAIRGYFQGLQQMTPTAVSQVIEQITRVATMFLLAWYLLPYGLEFAAAGATFGATTGGIVGLGYIIWYYWRHRREDRLLPVVSGPQTVPPLESTSQIFQRIFTLAVPISLASIVLPIMSLIDSTIVPYRLQVAGFAMERATDLYGQLANIAFPLVNMPTILTVGLAVSLVPAISEAQSKGSPSLIRSRAMSAIRISGLFALPAATGLFLLATPISTLLYDVPEGGRPLQALAFGLVFLALQQTSSGVLQGLGRTDIPVRNLIVGAVCKLVMTWFLTPLPGLDVQGAALASVVGFGLTCLLNLLSMHRLVGISLNIADFLVRPLLALVVMALMVNGSYWGAVEAIGNSLATLIAIALGALVYTVALLLVGGIRERDLEMVPRIGPRIAKTLRKVGLLRR
ncbi:MAG TPA: polysaccharide biosynthesis protein [Firmicutes bacterium]|jgi:stage V sporulation protein B|nr:polysaccharide biosynthesis protein [Bacillota bacterium]